MTPYPTHLFKYLPRQYAHDMVTRGTVRVGTLYEYRNEEALGSQIGDKDEGRSMEYDYIGDRLLRSDSPESWIVKKAISLGPGATAHVVDATFREGGESANVLVYCTAKTYDESSMRAFGCDTAVRIHDVAHFFGALNDALLATVPGLGNGGAKSCDYRGRHLQAGASVTHPAWLKDRRYAHQCEYRAAWEVPQAEARPRIITVPEISACCEIFRP